MPPLDFTNGLPDIPDEDYQQWSRDEWRKNAQEQLDAPLKEMPAPTPPAPQQADDGFLKQAQGQLDATTQAAVAPAPAPQDDFVQDAQKQLDDTTAKANIPTALPAAGDGGGSGNGLVWNGTYWQDPNFRANIQRYGSEVARQLGPDIGNFAMAQARLETGGGSSLSTPYNYGNVGNTDDNPRGGGQYSSPEEAAQAWVRFITNNGNNANAQQNRYHDFVAAGQAGADVGTLATLIKKAGYATDPDYALKVARQAGQALPPDTPYAGLDAPGSTPSPVNSPPPTGQRYGLMGALGNAKDWLGGVKDQLGSGIQGFMSGVTGFDPNQPVGPDNQGNGLGVGNMGSPDPFRADVSGHGLDPNNPLDLGQYTSDKLADAISQTSVGQDYDQTALGQSLVGPVLKSVLDPVQWLTFAAGGAVGDVAAGALGGGKLFDTALPAVGRALANGVLTANETAEHSNDPGDILKGFVQGMAAGGLMEGGTLAVSKALGTIFSRLRGHVGSDVAPAADVTSDTQAGGRQPIPEAQQAASDYAQQAGLPEPQQLPYVANDVPTQQRIAQAYDEAPHTPDDPAVKSSYQALANDVQKQYQFLTDKGVKFEPFTGADPYFSADPANPSKAMQSDLRDNNHLWVYAGDNKPAGLTPEQNWQFRAVHDYFGHAADGNGFGPRGEENAWLAHRQMFSPEAIPALTTETRGQNSWVNFGPHSDSAPSERPFADQKATILPEEFHNRPMGGGSVDMLKPGEALDANRTPEAMPNYGLLSREPRVKFDAGGLDPAGNTKGAGFVIPRPTVSERVADAIRPFIRALRPNIHIPYADALEFDKNATSFTRHVGDNRSAIASGEYRPEAALVGHFATIGSIQRGAAPYTKFMDAAGPEAAMRMKPDLNLQNTVSRNDTKGVNVRPEIAAAHFVGDTTNPGMMSMLYAITHPGSFGSEAGREAVIQQGATELYRKMGIAGHGARNDLATIQGLPIKRSNGAMSGPMPSWKDRFPQLWQKTVEWAKGNQSFTDGLRDSYIGDSRMPGEGSVKGRFAASMSGVSPEPATLDARIMTDVYGLRGDQASNLTPAEYEYLTQQLRDATGAKSGYEGQWGVWSYVGGSKTSYDSLLATQQNVSDFFARAEQLASKTGQSVEDIIPRLAEQEPKLDVRLSDPAYVTSQIGLASDRIQHLPAGASWSTIKEVVPQLDSLARQAGLEIQGGVKTGLGFWKEGAKADFEKNFNLVVSGPKPAVEWFAAAMAKMEPSAYGESQGAVLVTHYGQGGNTPAIKLPVRGLQPEEAERVANLLVDHLNGFDIGWENVRAGQGHIHMVGLDEDGHPMDPADFQERINRVAEVLRQNDIATAGSTEVQLADARVIHSDEYDQVIRGGPSGAYSEADNRGLESPIDAGGAGDRSPPGGARQTEGSQSGPTLGDNNRSEVVPAQEGRPDAGVGLSSDAHGTGDAGLTYLNAGLKLSGRHIAGGAIGAAAGNISTPADATDEERRARISAGAAAGVLGSMVHPDMVRPALGRVALKALGKETTGAIASKMGDFGYRWNRALAPLKNVPDDVRGAFVDFGNRRLQNQQIAKTLELKGEALFGKTGSDFNGLEQAKEFEETGDLGESMGILGTTSAQQDYIDQMKRFGQASRSVGQGKKFIFGDVTQSPDVKEYFPHLYEKEATAAQASSRRLGLSPQNFYSYQREAPTLAAAEAAGNKPVDSFTGVWSKYVNGFLDSEAKADLRRQLMEAGAVKRIGKNGVPDGWVRLEDIDPVFKGYPANTPGYVGTQATADALKALTQASWFRSDAPGAPLIAGIMNIGGEAKKQLLTLSGFHAKNLIQNVYRGVPARDVPAVIGKSLYNAVSPKAFGVYRLAKADAFEDAAGHGMTIPGESGPDVESTVTGELKRRAIGAGLGATFGYGKAKAQGDDDLDALKQGLAYGAAGGALSGKLTDEYAKALWTRLVPTMKVEAYQALASRAAGDAGKDAAAEFSNNSFGGQNLAKIGRSQTVQDMLRLSFLAPDWWEGWARMIGSSVPDTTLGGMSKSFWLKTAAIDGAFALEGLNLAFNGHLTNENEEGRQFELETTGLLDKLGVEHTGRQYLDILGPIQAILKLATTGNIGRFYESRTSIAGSVGLQLHENKDYGTGQPIIEPGTTALQAAPQIASSIVQRVAPVGLQQAESAQTSGRAIPGEAASMLTGMRQYGGPDKGAQLDRRDTDVEDALGKVMGDLSSSQRYQDATPEERIAMKSDARKQLQGEIGDQIGIAPSKGVQARERKYAGVDDPTEEKHIDFAIQKVQNWKRDPRNFPRPSGDEIQLASRYSGRLTPAYQQQLKQTKLGNADISSLIDKYAPAYGR